jgi:hypothetical protein
LRRWASARRLHSAHRSMSDEQRRNGNMSLASLPI